MMEKNYINLDWNLVEKIYSDKVKRLKRIAYKRVNDIEVAEDIVQNTMESICKRVNKDKKIVIYKFIYGFNNTEISKIFGCCNQTVTRKIEKSLEIMREKLLIG